VRYTKQSLYPPIVINGNMFSLFLCNQIHLQLLQAEELFDVASRYLLFPLKRVVADMLLPHLEHVSPAELCHWLMLSDMYVCLLLLMLVIVIILFSVILNVTFCS
jgi:hypothetical protein